MQGSTLCVVLVSLGLARSATITGEQAANDWEQFKGLHGKSYSSLEEDSMRKQKFQETVAQIREHNRRFLSGQETYSMRVNKFSDMTLEELTGNRFEQENLNETASYKYFPLENPPDAVDWRTQGAVTPVKDETLCDASWSFSATGALEGQMKIKKNQEVSLSEQQLMDCSEENQACFGGLMSLAFDYIRENGGIMAEDTYPFHPYNGTCKFDETKVVAKVSGYVQLGPQQEDQLLHAIANVGPISVKVQITKNFVNYYSGIFDDPTCHTDYEYLNHGLLAVGYKFDGDSGYIILKNSWGTNWGEDGYIRFKAKKNLCGIATYQLYPILED